jgi:hypothetical protein
MLETDPLHSKISLLTEQTPKLSYALLYSEFRNSLKQMLKEERRKLEETKLNAKFICPLYVKQLREDAMMKLCYILADCRPVEIQNKNLATIKVSIF